jgi:CRP-like cAMP-binding protein
MSDLQNPLEPLVRKLELYSPLSNEEREALLGLPYTLRTLEASTYLLREGDHPERCVILVSGFAFRQKLTGDGTRQIVALHIPGEALDFQNLFLDVSDHGLQMLTRGEVAFVPRIAFQKLAASHPTIAQAILVTILVEASIFREWILNVGRRDARTRIAHVLCEFAIRLEAQGLIAQYGYELPMTQEQLGDVVGLTPIHVNRVLKILEADELITRSRGVIGFPQWQKMRAIGDFNQRFLHLEQQAAPRI